MKNSKPEQARVPYPLTEAQIAQLRALESREPDTTDIAELPDANWATAVRGKHHAMMQNTIAIRLDGDVMDWLLRKGPRYPEEVNRILRERMKAEVVT
jgi:uncharacterized protein (DUF4415 family)